MIVVPLYVLMVVPVLITWWTRRRCDRHEYSLLTISFLLSLILLIVVEQHWHLIATRYDGPLAPAGIETGQVIGALFVTTLVAVVPVKPRVLKLLRDFAAVIVGEMVILHETWIS